MREWVKCVLCQSEQTVKYIPLWRSCKNVHHVILNIVMIEVPNANNMNEGYSFSIIREKERNESHTLFWILYSSDSSISLFTIWATAFSTWIQSEFCARVLLLSFIAFIFSNSIQTLGCVSLFLTMLFMMIERVELLLSWVKIDIKFVGNNIPCLAFMFDMLSSEATRKCIHNMKLFGDVSDNFFAFHSVMP
jgi:hypothetical protein